MSNGKTNIAVVDDDDSFARALSRLLRASGFEVETYPSGEAFLVPRRLRQPDCLVLDIQLQGMSGLNLLRRVRELGSITPVIFVTAATRRRHARRQNGPAASLTCANPREAARSSKRWQRRGGWAGSPLHHDRHTCNETKPGGPPCRRSVPKPIGPSLTDPNRATDRESKNHKTTMKTRTIQHYGLSLLTAGAVFYGVAASVHAADKKPDILVIWGDGIGTWNVGAYTHGMMASSS